ncbi:MAG: hypothetical protein K2L82_06315, partial [Lachnospiraceae bacterium]|nr:hypothetical protein [Lachnospiraceae bacterium]
MGDNSTIIDLLNAWLQSWRGNNNVPPKTVLSGETLSKFIADLQNEIVNVIEDFGKNSIGENAKLVLYSGLEYNTVQDFCEVSNGEYYMISQTAADVLWNPIFRQTVVDAIGEQKVTDSTTAQVLEGKKYNADGSWERINQYATESGNYLVLDDFISSKVAEAGLAKGNVVYLVGEGLKPDSV